MEKYTETIRIGIHLILNLGRGTFMMVFDHYEDVPKSVQEEIIKKNSGE